MIDERRIEVVARALARHRLSRGGMLGDADSETTKRILDGAVERLWRDLREEARVAIEALEESDHEVEPAT